MDAFSTWRRDSERGNYSMLMGVMAVVLIGFAAFSVDISLITMAELECQATADAASHAALVAWRRNFVTSDGDSAATFAVNYDPIAMGHGTLDAGYPVYGTYDFAVKAFTAGLNSDGSGNAV